MFKRCFVLNRPAVQTDRTGSNSVGLFQFIVVVGAFAADEFRAGSRGGDKCVAHAVVLEPYRHRNFFQVHADHRKSDVKSRIGFDVLERDGVLQRMIARRCERTARFRKRYDIYFIAVPGSRTFGYYCAVEMFAALRGYEYAAFVARLFYSVEKRLRRFGTGIRADFFAEYFTR